MMTFIDGVGDEVIYFVGVAIVIIILALAWNSTSVITVYDRQYRGSVSEHALFRTAFSLLERRRRSLNNNNTNAPVGVINNNTEARNRSNNVTNIRAVENATAGSHADGSQSPSASVSNSHLQPTAPSQQATTESHSNDASLIENDPYGIERSEGILLPGTNEDGRPILQVPDRQEQAYESMSPIAETPSFLEKVSAPPAVIPEPAEENPSPAEALVDGHIRVRLKFLNDTQRSVEARLVDQLGQFKQQHFGEELGSNKIVRLIFNGQLLQRDQETLQFHGLFDNCVVHCHISSTARSPSAPVFSPQVELDLSRLMLPLFGLILGMIWCCRIQYRQYFNGTSTFALLCITGFFALSLVAMWLPTRNRQIRG